MHSELAAKAAYVDQKGPLYCGFCGACNTQVAIMVKGECENAICGDCVDLCGEIVLAHKTMRAGDLEYDSWLAVLRTPNVRGQPEPR